MKRATLLLTGLALLSTAGCQLGLTPGAILASIDQVERVRSVVCGLLGDLASQCPVCF